MTTRRQKLEALLAESPDDSFLHYALAMQFAADGDDREAFTRMESLLDRDPHYVPAWFQAAQIVVRLGEGGRAKQLLTRGIEAARRAGDEHAEGEMRGLLNELSGV